MEFVHMIIFLLPGNLRSEEILHKNNVFYAKLKSERRINDSRFQQHGSVSPSEENTKILLNKWLFGDKGVVNLKILRKEYPLKPKEKSAPFLQNCSWEELRFAFLKPDLQSFDINGYI